MSEDTKDERKETEVAEEQSEVKSTAGVSKNNKKSVNGIILAVVALAALFAILQFTGAINLGGSSDTDDKNLSMVGTNEGSPTDVIAKVNGKEILRADLDKRLAEIQSSIPEGNQDPTLDANFQLQIVDELVNLELLKQLASDAGYTVTDEDVAKEVTEVTQVFGTDEELDAQLTAVGLTRDQFEENVKNELLIRQLIEAETDIEDIEVTDDEIETAYNQAFANQEDAPSLEEAADFIKEQLTQQETTTIVQTYLGEVRSDADIEVLL